MPWRQARKAALMILVALLLPRASVDGCWAAEPELPKPVVVDLDTKDGLRLMATYYGQAQGSKAVPIVMLHDFKGSRNALSDLAQRFQQTGHVVMVPDLRGHGDSTKFGAQTWRGDQTIEATSMRRGDFAHMVQFDMEAVRRFLVQKNDAQELNLNRLCIIGAGMGATVALNWTARDWIAPPLAVGKQGQDVKALVLISPEWSFKGVPIQDALRILGDRTVGDKLSVLILVGRNNARAVRDARRIYKSLERWHPEPSRSDGEVKRTLYLHTPDTSLQGLKLLDANGMRLAEGLEKFIQWRAADPDYPWTARRPTSD